MRTNIDIEEISLNRLMELSGARTKKEAVNDAIEKAAQYYSRLKILNLRGKIKWEGDLDQMRTYDKWEE